MRPRILIVGHSVVRRRSLTELLSDSPIVDVVGAAADGRIACMKVPLLSPDLVVLTIDAPERKGIETLVTIREAHPLLPVIVVTESSREGTAAAVHALALGACDSVTTSSDAARSAVRWLSCSVAQTALPSACRRFHPATRATASRVDVLAIGISMGGPNALMRLLPTLPADFPVPILIVQHMPPLFTRLLAERLAASCRVPVREAGGHERLEPATAWIAPGDFHMVVARHDGEIVLRTHQAPLENSCRPAADTLFRSVAQVYGSHALAVVMTGMGQDGLRGCAMIRQSGGQVLVQDESSSVVWGMPGFIARAGLADRVVSLEDLGSEIVQRVAEHRSRPPVVVGT